MASDRVSLFLLNLVSASTHDIQEVIHLEEEESFTSTEAVTATKEMKLGKTAGEDEILPEMLKALTGEGILCLKTVCQVG